MSLKSMEHSFYLNGSNTREHLLSWNYNTKNKTKKYFFKIFTLEKKSDEGEIKKKKKDEGKSNKKENLRTSLLNNKKKKKLYIFYSKSCYLLKHYMQ